jgi:hypothetical protein
MEVAMRRLLAAVLVVLLFAVPALGNGRTENIFNGGKETYYAPVPGPVFDGGRDILWDNGPLESQPGLSVLDTTLGMSIFGFGHHVSGGYRIADEFIIPAGHTWEIHTVTFFAYQTGSLTNPSTITAVYVELWDGPPDNPGSSIIWGDISTNTLMTSMWTGLYRVTDYDLGGTSRPIMANTCSVPITLTAGDYWLVWKSDGSLTSGPWAPPITMPGVIGTGNGMQYTESTSSWAAAMDVEQQGFPFIVEGVHPTPVEETTWAAVKALFE